MVKIHHISIKSSSTNSNFLITATTTQQLLALMLSKIQAIKYYMIQRQNRIKSVFYTTNYKNSITSATVEE